MDTSPQAFSLSLTHASILVVDIEGFGLSHRTERDRGAVREALYRLLNTVLTESLGAAENAYVEDRGDGMLVVVPPAVPKHLLVTAIPNQLARALREHNQAHPPESRIRLRMAVHAGEIGRDEYGVVGVPIKHAFQMLDEAASKHALADSSTDLALIVSQWIFDEVVLKDPELDPDAWRPVTLHRGRASTAAWVRLFPNPQPSPRQTADFDEFYLGNFRFVRNVVNARAQDWTLAAEVTDEAMTIAYRKWDEVRKHPNLIGFVVVTARRILSRVQRQRAKQMPPVPPLSLEGTPGLELRSGDADPADTAVNRTAIQEALRALPADQRECFVLHNVLDQPTKRVAELLNLPEGTVKTRLSAARKSLRELLDDDLGKEGPQ